MLDLLSCIGMDLQMWCTVKQAYVHFFSRNAVTAFSSLAFSSLAFSSVATVSVTNLQRDKPNIRGVSGCPLKHVFQLLAWPQSSLFVFLPVMLYFLEACLADLCGLHLQHYQVVTSLHVQPSLLSALLQSTA